MACSQPTIESSCQAATQHIKCFELRAAKARYEITLETLMWHKAKWEDAL